MGVLPCWRCSDSETVQKISFLNLDMKIFRYIVDKNLKNSVYDRFISLRKEL